jgi:hypothetical protein
MTNLPLDDSYGILGAELARMNRVAGRKPSESLTTGEFLDIRDDIARAGGGDGRSAYLSDAGLGEFLRRLDRPKPLGRSTDPFQRPSFGLIDPLGR